jgi:hypothetical protein
MNYKVYVLHNSNHSRWVLAAASSGAKGREKNFERITQKDYIKKSIGVLKPFL